MIHCTRPDWIPKQQCITILLCHHYVNATQMTITRRRLLDNNNIVEYIIWSVNIQKVTEAYHILKSISQCHQIFQYKRYPSRNSVFNRNKQKKSHIWFLFECCCFGSRTIRYSKQKQVINWDIETRSLWMIFLSEISLEFSLANHDPISDRVVLVKRKTSIALHNWYD